MNYDLHNFFVKHEREKDVKKSYDPIPSPQYSEAQA